jgi:hypothetical protein
MGAALAPTPRSGQLEASRCGNLASLDGARVSADMPILRAQESCAAVGRSTLTGACRLASRWHGQRQHRPDVWSGDVIRSAERLFADVLIRVKVALHH